MTDAFLMELLKAVAMLCQSHATDWRGLAEQRACQREVLQCAANVKDARAIPTQLFNCVTGNPKSK